MAKVTPRPRNQGRESISVKTKMNSTNKATVYKWWKAKSKDQLAQELISTATFLKDQQQYRWRQIGIYARLYGNMPLTGLAGSYLNRLSAGQGLPMDRPTMNVVQSCIDTKVARISQAKPRPVFLTDDADSKMRTLAKEMNQFIGGELYQLDAYTMGELMLRDAGALGTGVTKIIETIDHKVGLERRINTQLLVDPDEAMLGRPRQLYEMALVDRELLAEYFPKYRSDIAKAEQAFPESGGDSSRTVSDLVMVVEGWRLPSGKDTGDGYHAVACSSGLIMDDPEWNKQKFPFVFFHDSPMITGFWGQGTAERLMGTQVQINSLLQTITQSINLVGVPRVFVEDGSKVVKAHLNNNVGAIVTYQGTKPIYEVAPCMPQEVYAQLQRLVEYAYQQEGISQMAAESRKPPGLDSGEAIREYDDIQSDRMATLSMRYQKYYEELVMQIIDKAVDIAKEQGSYESVFPGKQGLVQINLPDVEKLDDPYVIKCHDSSSLPKTPSGRKQEIIEMMQAGLISLDEGRRLLDFSDLDQFQKLANAGEEALLMQLDDIVEKGKFEGPDPTTPLLLAEERVTQYLNIGKMTKLPEKRMQMLRDYGIQVQDLKTAALPPAAPPMPPGGPGAPQAVPEGPPTSPMLPNMPQTAA